MSEDDDETESALQLLSQDIPPPDIGDALRTLAAASKRSEAIRQQLANPTILKNITSLLHRSVTDSETADSALRCIGNACIDSDDARDIIASEDIGFRWANRCLQNGDEGIQLLTTKVLNNVCCDHEASQRLCYQQRIHWDLLHFLNSVIVAEMSTERKMAGELDSAIDVLFLVSGQKAGLEESAAKEELNDDVLRRLLNLHAIWTNDLDIETFATISETTLVFLRDEKVQRQIIEKRLFEIVWAFFEEQERLIERPDIEQEDLKLLKPLQASLVWCLSDISANQAFSSPYSWQSTELRFAESILQQASENAVGQKLNAASQILGNVLWQDESPQSYSLLVTSSEIHKPLLDVIANDSSLSADTLHSIAGLLVQLSRPSIEVRERIGADSHARAAIERLCRHERPEIKQDGVKLVKALGKDCQENQRRFADLAAEAMAGMQQPATSD